MSFIANLSPPELDTFLKIIQESLLIRRHEELFQWLHDDVQRFLSHDVLIAAWGDFSLGVVHLDLISHLPGSRTAEVEKERLLPHLSKLFDHWVGSGRSSVIVCLDGANGYLNIGDGARMLDFLVGMRTAVVHGIKDERGRQDCLYVALSSRRDAFDDRAVKSMEILLPYVDAALRQVAHLPVQYPDLPDLENDLEAEQPAPDGENIWNLSGRELEIMHWVQQGKTNAEIGLILDISSFTVKNHLQRIFRKLDVLNRAQAVSIFSGNRSEQNRRLTSR
ncbi:MAG TPA: XrtB/PEP-CTERM-associated transcriptional regulator EpsA [Rhodocyclaceae bacterium]